MPEEIRKKPPKKRVSWWEEEGEGEFGVSEWAKKYPHSAGTVFGPETAKMLGLDPERGYREEEYEDWFGKLRGVSAALENYPQYNLPYWARAAQMGIPGEQYLSAFQTPPTGLTPQEQAIQDYAFGKTDINPLGGAVIPPGITPTMGAGYGGGREEYPFLPQQPTPRPAPRPAAPATRRYGYAPPARWLLF